MSTAFLITFPLMLLAILVAVVPLLAVTIREHRPSARQSSRSKVSASRGPTETPVILGKPDGDAQAAVFVLEEAAIAVDRLRARRGVTPSAEVDESLHRASDDLHRALVSLGQVGR